MQTKSAEMPDDTVEASRQVKAALGELHGSLEALLTNSIAMRAAIIDVRRQMGSEDPESALPPFTVIPGGKDQ
jgi:hypothetical protein